MNEKYNILHIDDEVINLKVFKNTFRRNFNIYTSLSAKDGLRILDQKKIDLILVYQRIPATDGVDFLKEVMLKYPSSKQILITTYNDFNAIKNAVSGAKIYQFILKSQDETETQQDIDNALEIHHLKQVNRQLKDELRKNNEELARLKNELQELDKLKFQFLNILSHEIRTPLNGLIGATSLFRDNISNSGSSGNEELFQMLDTSTQRLAHFLLLAERIILFKTNKYNLNPEPSDINKLIERIIHNVRCELKEKNINLVCDFSSHDSICYIDKPLIEICLNEILNNAIKYSRYKGKITLRTYPEEKDILIEIIDEGPGFSKKVLKNLYKPFITDDNLVRAGLGLDLALIKLILEAHNSSIHIRNNENKGSTVQLLINKQIS